MEDKKINLIDDGINKSFNDVVSDITEFVDCAQRCILPHNTLMFNVIMNSLEMMIMRSELEGRETEFSGIIVTGESNNNNSCEDCNFNNAENYISEKTREEVDSVINDIMNTIEEK